MDPTVLQIDVFSNLAQAAAFVFQPSMFVFVLIGTVLGLVFGAIPGLGGTVALALLVTVTFNMPSDQVMLILASTLGGTAFGGSISAILINTPGTGPNAATIIDGYPMAEQGEGAKAIGVSATSSAMGAIFGLAILLVLIPWMYPILLLFGPPEQFMLAIFGLSVIAVATRGSTINGLIAGGIGLLLAMVGYNPITGDERYTLGFLYLYDGVKFIPVIIGLFAIGEAMKLYVSGESIAGQGVEISGSAIDGVKETFRNWRILLQSSAIGMLIGIIPGVGGTVANFISYVRAKQSVKDASNFGFGDVRGVIATEAANDAKDGGALIPTLGLGIPGSAALAVLLGGFVLHGVAPGPNLLLNHSELVFIIIVSLLVSNILVSAIGIATAKHLVKITKIDPNLIVPIIIMLSYIGVYATNNAFGDLIVATIFGFIGYHMIVFDFSRIALVIALILGEIAEISFFTALQLGGPLIFFTKPIPIILLVLTLLSFVHAYRQEGQDFTV